MHDGLDGPVDMAAKTAVVTISSALNMDESRNARPLMYCRRARSSRPNERSVAVTAAEGAMRLQPRDVAPCIQGIAALQPHTCINEVGTCPTLNRPPH